MIDKNDAIKSTATVQNTAIIIPIYNTENHLEELFERITKFIPMTQIIVINDASTDNSLDICMQKKCHVISFHRNKGKGAALRAGFQKAISLNFHFAFTIDGDLQHEPESFPLFFEQQNKSQADLIIGCRDFRFSKMPFARICSNKITSFIVSLFIKKKICDSQSGFRLYNLELIRYMKFNTNRYQFETEILLKLAKKNALISSVKIKTIYQDEISYIRHGRDIRNFIKVVLDETIFGR